MGRYEETGGVVPETGVEPVHLAAADFKSATSTNFVTRAVLKWPLYSTVSGVVCPRPKRPETAAGDHFADKSWVGLATDNNHI